MVSIDVTHEIGHNAVRAENINPLQDGLRLLAGGARRPSLSCQPVRQTQHYHSYNKSRYGAMTLMFRPRFPHDDLQTCYVMLGAGRALFDAAGGPPAKLERVHVSKAGQITSVNQRCWHGPALASKVATDSVM
jgi:hypothetical protein